MSQTINISVNGLLTTLAGAELLNKGVFLAGEEPSGSCTALVSQVIPTESSLIRFTQKSIILASEETVAFSIGEYDGMTRLMDLLGAEVYLTHLSMLLLHNKGSNIIRLSPTIGETLPFLNNENGWVTILPSGVFLVSMPADQGYYLGTNSSIQIENLNSGECLVDLYVCGLGAS